MKIIVTGAAGEVGINLLLLMNKKENNIIAIDKNNNNLRILKKLCPEIKTLDADLAYKGRWEKYFRNTDVVIQLQAQISSLDEKAYLKNNIHSVQNVIAVCEKYHVANLIHASSSVVISVAKDNYTETKRTGEKIVKNSRIPYTILRPSLMYGCFDIKHLSYLIRMFERYPFFLMPGSGKYVRQPLYVEDFCNVILSCASMKPENKLYNIIGKEKINLIDCLKIIFHERKKNITFIKIPLPLFHLLIQVYGFINRKTPIVSDQLTSLTAGDIFPVIAWDNTFHVKSTPYAEGVRKMITSKYYDYDKRMVRIEY